MPVLNRVLFNVLCQDLEASVSFYRELFGLETVYESDWFVVLTPAGQPNVQIGLIDQVSEFTPRHAWGMHEGTYLTFVVEDVIDVMDRARAMGAEIVSEAIALDYGQTRGLIRDLNGMVIDVSTQPMSCRRTTKHRPEIRKKSRNTRSRPKTGGCPHATERRKRLTTRPSSSSRPTKIAAMPTK